MATNFLEQLITFMGSFRGSFKAGVWLETLSDEDLTELVELSELMSMGDRDATDKLLPLALMIIATEMQSNEIKVDPDLISGIGMLATFQKFASYGYLKLHKPLSLTEEMSFEFTPLGLKKGQEIQQKWDRYTFH